MAKVHGVTKDVCLEGTSKVPTRWKPCCQDFKYRTTTCLYDVRYEWYNRLRRWGIPLSPIVGGGFIEMQYCPHCGAKLNGRGSTKATTGDSRRKKE